MAKAVTLKDKDGNVLYPTTSADLIVGAPSWKVVAVSYTSSVNIPLNYKIYRIKLFGAKTNTSSWGEIFCSQATGTTWTYIQGVWNGTWTVAERQVTASSDKSIADGARGATASGMQSWNLDLYRPTTTATTFHTLYQVSTSGSATYNTGRSIFNIPSGLTSMTFSAEMTSQITWIVEAFVEE